MSKAAFFLGLDARQWHVARVRDSNVELREVRAGNEGDLLGEPLKEAVAVTKQWGYDGRGVCLGLPGDMVLAARIDCGNLPRKRRRSAMIFRLEDHLPLGAEELTADFLPARGGSAMGLAVETARVQAVISRLAELGVEIASICPTAFLALWQYLKGNPEHEDYVILAGTSEIDVFRMAAGQPHAWYSIPPDSGELCRCLEADMLSLPMESEEPMARIVGKLGWQPAPPLGQGIAIREEQTEEQAPIVAAALAARRVLSGESAGWVDFRRDDLAAVGAWGHLAGLVRSAAALVILLLIILTAMFCWRGTRYDQAANSSEREQVYLFGNLFPNRRVPLNPKMALNSELKLLAGVRGADNSVPQQPNALDYLRRIAANLPPAVRFRIVDLRVEPTGILIQGQARNHSDAEVISRALQRGGFQMESPRTEHLVRGGVAFTLLGKPGEEAQGVAATTGGKRQ